MRPESTRKALRCAIYTRVSTDHGLEQDFNSLDAQREASEAYIKSQAHEGWKLIRDRFDDGGFSGGSMERPALQKLLADVRSRKVDVIVVYKVDRLTRSLADFAKLVELFDAHRVSFVSVTQSFNTTTSMGRLTLNVLLSFAHFEREVTGERIRDKIAASKKKGIWMGGGVPLGYRVEKRALHIVAEHAEIVRSLFDRYLALGSVVRLKKALDAEGVRVPVRINGAGNQTGGGLFSRGHLYQMLGNPIYVGRLAHKGQVHEGQHAAIVDRSVWDRVQQQFAAQTQAKGTSSQSSGALLVGKLFDDRGERMTPSWATKGGRRWRYYVSQALLKGRKGDAGSVARVSAGDVELVVMRAMANAVDKARSASGQFLLRTSDAAQNQPESIAPAAERDVFDQRRVVREAIERVTISRTMIEITLAGTDMHEADGDAACEGPDRVIRLPWTPSSSTRRREIIQGDGEDRSPTTARPMRVKARVALIDALRKSRRWLGALTTDPTQTVEAIASREGRTERSIRMILSLAFVAPDIIKAAIEGRLPRGFGMTRLVDLPMAWPDQWRALGLKAPV